MHQRQLQVETQEPPSRQLPPGGREDHRRLPRDGQREKKEVFTDEKRFSRESRKQLDIELFGLQWEEAEVGLQELRI